MMPWIWERNLMSWCNLLRFLKNSSIWSFGFIVGFGDDMLRATTTFAFGMSVEIRRRETNAHNGMNVNSLLGRNIGVLGVA